ncbi:MAG: hypothetical protein EXR76_11400 [Myxococcales bacterium]|nr:hypothetical protein [Myxococcales bacterium]
MVFHEERRSCWVATVRAWKHSGLTQRAFAEREGVALDGLRRWCVRLGEAPRSSKRAAAGPRFVLLRFPSGVGPEFVAALVASRAESLAARRHRLENRETGAALGQRSRVGVPCRIC